MFILHRLGLCPQARQRFALRPLTVLVLNALAGICMLDSAKAEIIQFNSALLPDGPGSLDLSAYQYGNPVLPGQYRADILINGKLVSRQDILIRANGDGSDAVVCFGRGLLELIGVDLAKLSPQVVARLDTGETCLDLSEVVEGASAVFSPSSQQLDITIAQIALRRDARGYVSPDLWDSGVTAGFLSYNLNATRNRTNVGSYDSAYLGLYAGLNLGQWRLRHNGSSSWQKTQGQNYQAINTYAQRDITPLKSQLTVGEANTSGEIFDSLAYTGVQLASDERMLPDSQRGYAPVIRGIARTGARVAVRQAGNLLYETTVPPGAFEIDDLYGSGYGGDLEVTVYEADGTEETFSVPYAAGAQLLREGTSRFSVTLGQTRLDSTAFGEAKLMEGTYQRGLSNFFTGYGGVQASEGYYSVLAGLAMNMPVGALAFDLTQAETRLAGGTAKGHSARVTYSKNIVRTGSNFALAAMRFSTQDYLDFNNAVQLLGAEHAGLDTRGYSRPRSRISATLNQSLGDWGYVGVSGITQNYWNQAGSDVQYQLSYNNRWGSVGYSLSLNRSRAAQPQGQGKMQNSLMLNVSMPLAFGGSSRPRLSARIMRDAAGNVNEQATISGSAGADNQYNYGLTMDRSGSTGQASTTVNGTYNGSKAMLNASLSRGANYDSFSLSANGSVVAHPKGITLSPHRGDTMAVISAPGAAGAKVAGYSTLRLDGNGNAVVPYLRPYALNEVGIDPMGASFDVEFTETSQQVAPRAGAVVALEYGVKSGQAMLLNVTLEDGDTLPFGASVVDDRGVSVGVVGQGGQLYARLKENVRRLMIRWGSQLDQQCSLPLPALKNDGQQLHRLDVVCSARKPDSRVASNGRVERM
ncbi:fimbrial biogenesis outer membrane usher protein [Pseudomonas putida]|nr:fimbrial biogenesis outer membrane usher protein [Pseudomonas putida]